MLAMAVVMGGIQGGGMKRLSARFPEQGLVITGLALMSLAFVLVPVAPSVAWLMGPLGLAAVGRGIAQPPMMSLVSLAADEGSRGLVLGVFQSTASAARIVGPVLAGWLYDQALPYPYWAAGGLTALALALAWPLARRRLASDAAASRSAARA
jgi:DHA1 family tetracycline resistance protein-like MFS transporter